MGRDRRKNGSKQRIGSAIGEVLLSGAASIPGAPPMAASIPNMFGHVVEAHTT